MRGERTDRKVFVVAYLVCFVAMGAWSLATPLFAAPDEPSHVMRAAALVRGELFGNLNAYPNAPDTALGLVTLPKYYAVARSIPKCYHRSSGTPASCAPSAETLAAQSAVPRYLGIKCGADGNAPMVCEGYDYNARYQPPYYAVVGLPSLLGNANWAVYLMRLVAAALSALFLALAFTAVLCWSRSRLLLVGLVVAATPLAIYLGGTVNPSGLEIAAATCVWASGTILFLERPSNPARGLVAVFTASAAMLAVTRAISPLWLALAGLVFLALGRRSQLVNLWRRRDVRFGSGLISLAVVGSLIWTVKEKALLLQAPSAVALAAIRKSLPHSQLAILGDSFMHNAFYLPAMIGVFGSFDTFAPLFTYVVWYSLAIGLVAVAAVTGHWRQRLTLLAFVVAMLVVPVLISSSKVHQYGYTWNGRDTLPFALGLPIVAAALLERWWGRREVSRLLGVVSLLAGLASFAAFYEALRRYAVGTNGAIVGFLTRSSWRPPGGVVVALGLELVVLAVGGTLLYRVARTAEASTDAVVPEHDLAGAPR